MVNPAMVAQVNADVNPNTNSTPKGQRHSVPTQPTTGLPPTSQENVSDSMSLVRRYLNGKGLSTTATKVMEESWRSGTRKQYATYLQKWRRYCSLRDIDPICPSVEDGINFLAELYDSGIGYSAINTARSAVSSIITLPNNSSFGAHPMVCRFLKGVFELKPSLPKIQDHLGCQYCPDALVKPSPTSGFNFEGSHLQNYNAFSIVVWAEMSDTAFAICQLYGIEA